MWRLENMVQLARNLFALFYHAKKYVRYLWNFLLQISTTTLAIIWIILTLVLKFSFLKTYWSNSLNKQKDVIYIYIYIIHNTYKIYNIHFLSVYKGYHFILLIWRCLGIRYEIDVILRIATVGGFSTEVVLLSKGLNLYMKQSS